MSKHVLLAVLVSVLVVFGAPRAEADNETIQYTIRCEQEILGNGNGDEFSIRTEALFASNDDATLCEIDRFRRGRCCLENMQAVADALEGERSVDCVRTAGREDDDSRANGGGCQPVCADGGPCCEDAMVRTTCRASDLNHGKAVLAACETALDLDDCDID